MLEIKDLSALIRFDEFCLSRETAEQFLNLLHSHCPINRFSQEEVPSLLHATLILGKLASPAGAAYTQASSFRNLLLASMFFHGIEAL
jgi:hypothetical protein